MKGRGNFAKDFLGGLFLLLCFAFGLSSCQVGLGAAVDTSDPRAGVLVPSADSPYVGGPTIHISGTCEDDTGIGEIRILQIRNTSTGLEYNDLGNATLSDDGRSWSMDLVQSGSGKSTYTFGGRDLNLPDGSYMITILPVDIGGRSPRYGVERQFDIDNTPPIFLISSPNSTNINDPAPYGQTVKIKGEIYDSHDIRNLKVNVYDRTGSKVTLGKTKDLETIQSKDKVPFEILLAKKQYRDGEASDAVALSNFSTLYPDGSSGDNLYYMELELEDNVNSGTDMPGNKSRLVYFKSALYQKLGSLGINVTDSGDLVRGYSGTSDKFTAQQCDVIRRVLDGTYDDDTSYYARMSENSDGRLAFSVNPNNSPKYSFGGMAYSSSSVETWRGNKAAAGGTVTLMVSAASDEEEAKIRPETIVVTLVPVDADGTRLAGQAVTSENANGPTFDRGSTPVESATYTITLPDNLSYTYYELTASGQDGQGHSLEANAMGYGFMLYSNKIPVTITPVEDQKFLPKSDGNSYPFEIGVNDPNSIVTINTTGSVKYQVQTVNAYRTKSAFTAESWNGVLVREATLAAGGDANSFTSEIGVNYTVPAGGVGTIALRIWGDNGVESDKNVYLLYVDDGKPALMVNNAAELTGGLVKEDSTYYTAGEGKYTISGTWRDLDGSGAKKLEYKWGNEDWTPIGTTYSESSHVTDTLNWSISRNVSDGSGITVIIRATDQVGNTTVDSEYTYTDVTFDFGAPIFTVKPTETKADFFTTTHNFTAVATDGFGLQEITAVAKQGETIVASDSNGYSLTVTDTVAGNNKSKTATVRIAPASNADGEWEIELTATDLNGRSTPTTFGFTFDHT
ncbi:MAG: hypothetical protein J6Y16_08610, partial [Treponema sp.]|nr:hypothetical protein [Treponema sp.]